MKTLTGQSILVVAVFCTLFNVTAYGKSLKIYHAPLPGNESDTVLSGVFKVNLAEPELGRAWVEVTTRTETFEGENRVVEQTHRIPVDGLKFDPKLGQIIYSQQGQAQTTCATISERHILFLKANRVEPSGNCQLVTRLEKDLVDDGFFRKSPIFGKVTLEINER